MAFKLISNQVEEYICESERDNPEIQNPTIFGIVRLGKGQIDRLSSNFERGQRKMKGKTWESYRVEKLQREVWKAGIKYVKNIVMADGSFREKIDDPTEIAALYDNFPGEPAAEVIGEIQGLSQLSEDEEGNSESERDSVRSEN